MASCSFFALIHYKQSWIREQHIMFLKPSVFGDIWVDTAFINMDTPALNTSYFRLLSSVTSHRIKTPWTELAIPLKYLHRDCSYSLRKYLHGLSHLLNALPLDCVLGCWLGIHLYPGTVCLLTNNDSFKYKRQLTFLQQHVGNVSFVFLLMKLSLPQNGVEYTSFIVIQRNLL